MKIWEDIGTAEGGDGETVTDAQTLHDDLVNKGWVDGTDLKFLVVQGGQHVGGGRSVAPTRDAPVPEGGGEPPSALKRTLSTSWRVTESSGSLHSRCPFGSLCSESRSGTRHRPSGLFAVRVWPGSMRPKTSSRSSKYVAPKSW